MKRVSIFAHYDKDNIIDDYVILYLKALRQVSSDVIFVSDCNLPEVELRKLSEICIIKIAAKHGEYDFGSWKRGLAAAKERLNVDNYDQIVLANDSCYLLSPLTTIFAEMEKRNPVDFWGISIGKDKFDYHLQSYFLCFSKTTFKDLFFFMNMVSKQESKDDIIEKYEVGLTKLLTELGYKYDALCQKKFKSNPAINHYLELLKSGSHLIKKDLLIRNSKNVPNLYKFELFSNDEFIIPILNHVDKVAGSLEKLYLKPVIFGKVIKGNSLKYKFFGITIFKKKLNEKNKDIFINTESNTLLAQLGL